MTYATPTNLTSLVNASQYMNTVTNGLFWPIMGILVFTTIIILIAWRLSMGSPGVALTAGSFAMFLSSFFLRALGLIEGKWLVISIVCLAFSVLVLLAMRDRPM